MINPTYQNLKTSRLISICLGFLLISHSPSSYIAGLMLPGEIPLPSTKAVPSVLKRRVLVSTLEGEVERGLTMESETGYRVK